MTPDHKAALMLASAISDAKHQVASEYINLAAAYLERDRQLKELRELARPFIHFADRWDKKPIRGLDTTKLYTIHHGKDEAVFSLEDCKALRAALGEKP